VRGACNLTVTTRRVAIVKIERVFAMNRRSWWPLLALGLCGALPASTGPLSRNATELSVAAVARDAAVEVTAHAVLFVPAELIWRTLTDYEHLAQFVPGIASSRVLERRGSESIVEQEGGARFLIFFYPIRVTLRSDEHPYQGIDVHLLQGNLRRLDGRYQLQSRPDGSTELTWRGLIEPEQPLPRFVRTTLMRKTVSDQFSGMVREIERRATADSATGPGLP